MIQAIFQKKFNYNFSQGSKRNVRILLAIFIPIFGITVFQDFLESIRSGYSFYFSESILYKTIWFVFIPLLLLLNINLKKQNLVSLGKTSLFIVTAIIIHLIILSVVFLLFSILFYGGRYNLYEVLSYTLSNDFYKLVFIYSIFVFGHKYFSLKKTDSISLNEKFCISKIIIGNGINNIVVEVGDIYQIIASTPYISIQLESKKHLHAETLKSISEQLDENRFIRVHKSAIVNLDKVVSFKSRLNGDYDIILENNSEIRLSRTYVANFKNKFRMVHQVTI